MKILFTSDWQMELETIPICKKMAEEILALKDRLGFSMLVHCGDVKQHYNPVDVRVSNFASKVIGQFRKAGLRVVICLGNHDRVGMYVDKTNWFPILRNAGAEAFDDPASLGLGDGYSLRVLPFRTSEVLLRREAADLAGSERNEKAILVFHSDVQTAQYNVLKKSEAKLSVKDLHHERYQCCIGGHIHLQHKITGNVWYVGSPFATDWGESNQRKGYLIFDTKTEKLSRVRSEIPGWYDPSWPGFEEAKPENWKGARIRIKVPCADAKHVSTALLAAKEKAEKKYVGAEVLCIPEMAETEVKKGEILAEYSDSKKLDIYLKKTLPEKLEKHKDKILSYLLEQLQQAGGMIREGGELFFQKYEAENFLSFKKLEYKIEKGLCVVAGENRDWNRSNGAGKTSFLQPLAVALEAMTFKGQKHDKWMRRGTKKEEKSFVAVWLKDAQGRNVFVKRSRQPKKLRLFINGEAVESGNRPEATQKLIEQVTGYTWETLSSTIYVDQGRTHLMLTGTEAERKSFLARLQNLERFERAGKLVKAQKTASESALSTVQLALERLVSEASLLDSTIIHAKKILALGTNPEAAIVSAKKQLEVVTQKYLVWQKEVEGKKDSIKKQIEQQRKEYRVWERVKDQTINAIRIIEDDLSTFNDPLNRVCSVCRQPISEKHAKKEMEKAQNSIDTLKKKYKYLKNKPPSDGSELEKELWQLNRNSALEENVAKAKLARHKAEMDLEQYKKQQALISGWKEKKEKILAKIEEQKKKEKKFLSYMYVLNYAEQVFARNGLPAFLNAQLCPQLNREADFYSELFAQKEIQVRFAVDEEGRMDVQVVNAHGGEEVQDQSEGEMKMASLITSFAVRSAAPKTNLLILDEPGDGLDPISARQFARGLREVSKKFGSVLCITHNTNILSELADSKLITIVKENGISHLEER